jgi:hypothetical protein
MCAYLAAFQHNHEDLSFIVFFVMLKDTLDSDLSKTELKYMSASMNFAHVMLKFHYICFQEIA